MSKTKIVIALVAVAAIALVVIGLASAQISTYQNTTNPTTAPTGAPNPGFLGWIGRCFGFGANQPSVNPYYAPVQPAPTNTSVPAPAAPYQGGYGNGYGPCWARW
jgi:hypothetical protein